MVAYVEAPEGWAGRQIVLTRLERELGYRCEMRGIGESWRIYLM